MLVLDFSHFILRSSAFLVIQMAENPPARQKTWVWSLDWENPLEKGMVTHSSILAWKISWTVESMGLKRVGHDWATFTSFSGPLVLLQVVFIAFPSLISNCSALWNWEKVTEARVLPISNGGPKDFHAQESHRALLGIISSEGVTNAPRD